MCGRSVADSSETTRPPSVQATILHHSDAAAAPQHSSYMSFCTIFSERHLSLYIGRLQSLCQAPTAPSFHDEDCISLFVSSTSSWAQAISEISNGLGAVLSRCEGVVVIGGDHTISYPCLKVNAFVIETLRCVCRRKSRVHAAHADGTLKYSHWL